MKMIETKCTSKDIDLVIYIAQFQTVTGFIPNIYYKDVIQEVGLSPATLYRSLDRLQRKGILTYELSERYGYYNIQLAESDYSEVDIYSEHKYVNVNRFVFYSKEFRNLKASEKFVFLMLLSRDNKGHVLISATDTQIAIYAGVSAKNKFLIRKIATKVAKIVEDFNNVFNFKEEKKKDHTTYHYKVVGHARLPRFEREVLQRHIFTKYCDKRKIEYSEEEIQNLLKLENEFIYNNELFKKAVCIVLEKYRSIKCALIRTVAENMLKNIPNPDFYEKSTIIAIY